MHRRLIALAVGSAITASCGSSTVDTATAPVTTLETVAAADSGSAPLTTLPSASTTVPALVEWLVAEDPATMVGQTTIDKALELGRIPEFAEVAIRGQIVGLGPAQYLVAKSTRDAFDGSTARIARESGASISTPVVIRVHEVIASRADHPASIKLGQELTVWASGGEVTFTVSPEDAERTGLRPDINHEEEQALIDSGREPPSEPGPVPEVPFEFSYASPEFISVAEGQEVLAFLRWADWYDLVANDGTNHEDLRLLLALDSTGAGLFVRAPRAQTTTDVSFTHAATTAAFVEEDLLAAADELNDLAGRASSPTWLASELYQRREVVPDP